MNIQETRRTSAIGSFLQANEVINFLELRCTAFTAAFAVKACCKKHEIDNVEYYNAMDLSSVLSPKIYRELTADVNTYMYM